MVRLERITASNIGLLTNVAEDVFDAPINGKRLAALLAAGGHILLVAIEDDIVIGQCLAIILHGPDRSPALYIDNLGVAPDHQRKSIGSDLMRRVFDIGREEGCDWAWLGADPDSESAAPFYKSIGLRFTDISYAEFDLL